MAGAAARDGTAHLAMAPAVADATRTVSVETQGSDITVQESLSPTQATVDEKKKSSNLWTPNHEIFEVHISGS
jgi:hypothetical protein